jgi:hypothetical protein
MTYHKNSLESTTSISPAVGRSLSKIGSYYRLPYIHCGPDRVLTRTTSTFVNCYWDWFQFKSYFNWSLLSNGLTEGLSETTLVTISKLHPQAALNNAGIARSKAISTVCQTCSQIKGTRNQPLPGLQITQKPKESKESTNTIENKCKCCSVSNAY